MMRTYAYIDGFNLYYGAVKDTPYKWLDLRVLLGRILAPHHHILKIKYYTSLVSGKRDPQQPVRQETYLKALQAYIPEIEVYYGFFLTSRVKMPRASNPSRMVEVFKTEEKGSDVNLAVHLVNDAHRDEFDCAIVVSNDSDLAEAVRIVNHELGKKIGIVTPWQYHTSKELKQYATFVRRIREKALAQSQLPDPIPGTTITKPVSW